MWLLITSGSRCHPSRAYTVLGRAGRSLVASLEGKNLLDLGGNGFQLQSSHEVIRTSSPKAGGAWVLSGTSRSTRRWGISCQKTYRGLKVLEIPLIFGGSSRRRTANRQHSTGRSLPPAARAPQGRLAQCLCRGANRSAPQKPTPLHRSRA